MAADTADIKRFHANRQDEVDSASQYHAMAATEPDPDVVKIYRELAAIEEKHAAFWEDQLRKAGVEPGPRRPSWRARALAFAARRLGARSVLPTIAQKEMSDRDAYAGQSETAHTRMPAQERSHARVLASLARRRRGAPGSELARIEGRHRNVGGNALRAAVLGANDGLCSNLSLVMGVAGATTQSNVILVTGCAGLLAGACSMALGEWISVQSAKELAERELRTEAAELAAAPEEEREELELIYQAKGIAKDEARKMSEAVIADQGAALDILAREELGLDPDDLGGSPWTAAGTSFVLFAIGAIIPLVAFLVTSGVTAIAISVGMSALALFGIGAAITIFTGRGAIRSGMRQLVLGLAAAVLTFGVGHLLGVAVS
jgi:VIT1/CCC1 family predicted Fe2+/Mn2+ transporter